MKAILLTLIFGFATFAPNELPAPPWKRHTIDRADPASGKMGADGVRLADVNRDGRPDVVTGWENGNAIRVCLHPGKENVREPWPAVTVGKVKDAEDAVFTDLDGDLRVDVVSSCEGKTRSLFVHWAPSRPEDYLKADRWETGVFPCAEKKAHWMFAVTFDVDRDGDADLITGSKGENGAVGWLVNPGHDMARNLAAWRWKKLAPAGWIMSIRDLDLDGDGHREIVYSDRKGSRSGVWAMSHLTEEPWISAPVLLGFSGEEVMFLDIADLNGDQKPDIAAALRPQKFGGLIQPPERPWRTKWMTASIGAISNLTEFGTSKAIRIADLDLDGSLDAAATCENAKGVLSGVFSFPVQPQPDGIAGAAANISGSDGVKYDRIELVDLDGDGDLDLMTCEERFGLGVCWFENPARD